MTRRATAPRLAPAQRLDLFEPHASVAPAHPAAPAWAAEAAVEPATPRPSAPRNFAAVEERVACGAGLVVRRRTGERTSYYAYERADALFYGAYLAGDVGWGRVDTRQPARTLSPEDVLAFQREAEADAVAAIRAACPETRQPPGEPPSSGVYMSPGYVLMLVDPEPRYHAELAGGSRP